MRSSAERQPLPVWAGEFRTRKKVNEVVSYVWALGPLDVKLAGNGLTNVVYNVNWCLIGTDGDYSASVYGSCSVPAPAADSFTPFEQLTESQVQLWVETALGAERVAAYQDGISKQIEIKKNPVDASLQPPWN